mmetsp:Transcript_25575/g.86202  ORF Transcript_25575/g.86202 Transcript_25575/m.86202 type:complete len:277 (-) Transcript_25575:13-843(-)
MCTTLGGRACPSYSRRARHSRTARQRCGSSSTTCQASSRTSPNRARAGSPPTSSSCGCSPRRRSTGRCRTRCLVSVSRPIRSGWTCCTQQSFSSGSCQRRTSVCSSTSSRGSRPILCPPRSSSILGQSSRRCCTSCARRRWCPSHTHTGLVARPAPTSSRLVSGCRNLAAGSTRPSTRALPQQPRSGTRHRRRRWRARCSLSRAGTGRRASPPPSRTARKSRLGVPPAAACRYWLRTGTRAFAVGCVQGGPSPPGSVHFGALDTLARTFVLGHTKK